MANYGFQYCPSKNFSSLSCITDQKWQLQVLSVADSNIAAMKKFES